MVSWLVECSEVSVTWAGGQFATVGELGPHNTGTWRGGAQWTRGMAAGARSQSVP